MCYTGITGSIHIGTVSLHLSIQLIARVRTFIVSVMINNNK